MVVAQQFIQKVNGIIANEALIVGVYKGVPGLFRIPTEYVVVLCIQLDVVPVEVIEQILSPEHFGNLDKLVRVAVTMEEWFSSKNH